MSEDKSFLEVELESFRKQGKVYDILLSDLVMMQMVGDFDSFIQNLASKEENSFSIADQMISDTKKHATTAKLFSSIVEKTIEAQVGEKHAALRELGQNGIDSYSCSDISKPVVFDISKNGDGTVLRTRDYGVGMDLGGLIKNLLVPYNSGKEFDITKIGEHGIGWYSVVDLADFVKVVTKTECSEKATQALVYKKEGKWTSSILLEADNGFSEDLGKKPHGTEVIAHIPGTCANEEGIRNFLFRYLGMVDNDRAQIVLGKELVNSVRDEYNLAVPVGVSIEGKEMPLILGASKRKLKYFKDDARFVHRDLNLEKILFTQDGLFVKYDSVPFDHESIHEKLMRDMAFMGLDFWVDLPEHVTLTKGRNNIIADHGVAVLDGMYHAFENLFLDVLLTDNELLYHPSKVLLESISNLFNKKYSDTAELFEKRKYSLKRRLSSYGAAIGSKSVDIGVLVAQTIGKYSYKAVKYPFTTMPRHLREAASKLKKDLPGITRWVATRIALPVTAGLGLIYGAKELYEHHGSTPFIYIGCGIGALGAAWLVREIIKNYKNLPSESAGFKELLSDTYGFVKASTMYLLNKCGLYVDVEKKREKKRENQRRKISEKYLSKMKTDEFFKKVLNKKIIPAEHYWSENVSKKEEKPKGLSIGEMFKNFAEGNELSYINPKIFKGSAIFGLNKEITSLCIDDLIDLYLKGSLRYSKDSKHLSFRDGDYFVDYNNPIVNNVIGKLESITSQVKIKYDVKVLEDHLDNLVSFSKELGMAAYMMSPLGIVHLAGVMMFKGATNPFKEYYFYSKSSYLISEAIEAIKDYKEWMPILGNTAKGVVRIPYSITSAIAKGTYNHLLLPAAKTVNPARYPGYAKSFASSFKRMMEKRKKKAEIRAEAEKVMEEHDTEDKNWFKNLKDAFSELYHNSVINELFGYGVLKGNDFDSLSKRRLKYITKVVGVGDAYPDFMSMVEDLDGIVSKALDNKPFNIVMSYSLSRDHSYNHNGFMLPDKKGTLHVCLEKLDKLIYNTLTPYNPIEDKENLLAMLGHTVLDALIHHRTHEDLGYYIHNHLNNHDSSFHDQKFFDKKDELRRKVVDYLEKNGIQLTSHVEKFFPAKDEKKNYCVGVEYLSELVHMTRRRLRDEVLLYNNKDYTEKIKKSIFTELKESS
ncbi:MAG: hypothetical protein Q8O03_06640 [Nanoarchaeota archaeon]|nr:hypothetical protein [Nanoarchaeota archaeon]